jgi:hypothetical protein
VKKAIEVDRQLHSGIFGIGQGQVALVGVANVLVMDGSLCWAAVTFYDVGGNMLQRTELEVSGGQTGFAFLPGPDRRANRRDVRAQVVPLATHPVGGAACVVSLQLVDVQTGRSTFIGDAEILPPSE